MPVVPSVEARFDATLYKMQEIAAQNGTPYTSAFHAASYERLSDPHDETGQVLATAIQKMLVDRPHYSPINTARHFQRALTAMELWYIDKDPAFPLGKNVTDNWHPSLDKAVDGPLNRWALRRFTEMNVNSTVDSRAAAVKQIVIASGDHGPVSLVEVGPGRQHIPKRLAAHLTRKNMNFRPVDVMDATTENGVTNYHRNVDASQRMTGLLQKHPYHFGAYLGIDSEDIRDSMVKINAQASSLYLEEMANDHRRARDFERLDDIDIPGIDFLEADCANPLDTAAILAEHPSLGDGAGYGLASFVAYEIGPQRVQTMIDNLLALTHKAGKIILLDAVSVQPDGTLVFSESWGNYTTTAAFYDKSRPEIGWQTIATALNGRYRRMVIEDGMSTLPEAEALGMIPTRHHE